MWTWVRVSRRTLTLADQTNQYYNVNLELSVKGVSQVGGGNPGVFPAPPGCDPATFGSVVQVSSTYSLIGGSYYVVLAQSPQVGNGFIWVMAGRGTQDYGPTGFNVLPHYWAITGPGPGIHLRWRPVEAGDGLNIPGEIVQIGGSKLWLYEIAGLGSLVDDDGVSDIHHLPDAYVNLTPPAGASAFLISVTVLPDDTSGPDWTPAAGMTELVDTGQASPNVGIQVRVVSADGSAYQVGATSGRSNSDEAVSAAAFACSAGDNPPAPGQWVYDEIPTPPPGGGNTVFYTKWPYADGSLSVKVDNTRQTVTETDPATGKFSLAFDPRSFEIVMVTYQGR